MKQKNPGETKPSQKYKMTEKGRRFWNAILEPYEQMFPRDEKIQGEEEKE